MEEENQGYSPEDFPPDLGWFDVSRYAAAEDFDMEAWRKQIAMRALVRDQLKHGKPGSHRNNLIGELLEYPIVTANVAEYREHTSPVFALTPAYAKSLAEAYDAEGSEEDNYRSFNDAASYEVLQGVGHYAYLVVDLAAPTKEVRKAFNDWYREFMETKGLRHVPEVKQADMERWYIYQILPYFDIWAWAEWTGNPFPDDKTVRDLIYDSDEYTSEEKNNNFRQVEANTPLVISWRMQTALADQIESQSGVG